MKYKLFRTNQFKKSYKKLKIKDENEVKFIDISYHLLNVMPLDKIYKDHQLQGSLKEFRECHIKPDLLHFRVKISPICKIKPTPYM